MQDQLLTAEQFQQDQRFDYRFLRNKTELITVVVPDTDAATTTRYGVFFIAQAACVVEDVWEVHRALGTNGGAVTVDIEKLTSGQALDAGTTCLATALSLKTTIDVPQQGTLHATISRRQLARGDRLALKDAGTLTSVAHVCVTVVVRLKI